MAGGQNLTTFQDIEIGVGNVLIFSVIKKSTFVSCSFFLNKKNTIQFFPEE